MSGLACSAALTSLRGKPAAADPSRAAACRWRTRPSRTLAHSCAASQLGNISTLDIALFPLLYLVAACVLLYVRLAIGFLISLPTSPLAAELAVVQPFMQQLSTVLSSMFVSHDGEAVRVDTTSTLLMCVVLLNTSALRRR